MQFVAKRATKFLKLRLIFISEYLNHKNECLFNINPI